MESRFILAAIILSVFLFGYPLLTRSTKLSAPTAAKLGGPLAFFFGLFLLVAGLWNLFFGLKDGQMLWVSFHGNTLKNWFSFEDHEAAYIYMGLISSGWVLLGAGLLRLWAAVGREE